MQQTREKAKQIVTKGDQLTSTVEDTIDLLSQIVGTTLGPGGNPVLLERPGQPPLVTKDGVTVAQHVAFFDSLRDTIARAAREACQRTNSEVGDGTTTAIVLARELVVNGMEYLRANPHVSPQAFTRDMDAVVDRVIDFIHQNAVPVDPAQEKHLRDIALISSNSDIDCAGAVVEAIGIVGEDGTIMTEEGVTRETHVEKHEGFPINKGLSFMGGVQECFVNNPGDHECVYENPALLLFNGDILDAREFGQFLVERIFNVYHNQSENIPPIVVIAHKFSPQVISLIAKNVQHGTATMCLLETAATGHPQSKIHLLHDLAAFTGGKVLDPIGHNFNHGTIADLGRVNRSRLGRYKSVFFGATDPDGGLIYSEDIIERIDTLKKQLTHAESAYDGDLIRERIARLHGGVATIYVGGDSDLEMKEKKHRIEDAVNAVRAGIESGMVPGGGAALLVAGETLLLDGGPVEEVIGASIKKPFRRILENCGYSDEEIDQIARDVIYGAAAIDTGPDHRSFLEKLANLLWNRLDRAGLAGPDESVSIEEIPSRTFDSLNRKLVDPYLAGIVDPAKVTTTSLRNAVSIAKVLMTVGGAIVAPRDVQEERLAELQQQALQHTMSQAQG